MYALATALLVLAQAPPGQPPAGTPPGRDLPGPAAATNMLDGTWTVVAFERNGRPVTDANTMTVTIRNGTITFAGGDESARLQPMRLEFAANGMVRLVDTAGTDVPRRPGAALPAPTPPAGTPTTLPERLPGTERTPPGTVGRTGVYVVTRDYFVISLNDTPAGPGPDTPGGRPSTVPATPPVTPPGTPPGTPETRPGTPPATAPGTRPGADTPAAQPGGADYTAGYRPMPTATPYAVVILKRSTSPAAPGTDKK